MKSRILAGVITTVLACSVAHADNVVHKESKVGMLSGAAAGAAVGGPFGAAVGLIFGAVLGDNIGIARQEQSKAQRAESQLAQARDELVSAKAELAQASKQANQDPILAELADRLRADVLFRTGSAELQQDVSARLADIGALLTSHPSLEVEVHGFTDPRGSNTFNQDLSQRRAEVVLAALKEGGVDEQRIHISAHGKSMSTATAGDTEAFAWERRVSIAIKSSQPGTLAQAR